MIRVSARARVLLDEFEGLGWRGWDDPRTEKQKSLDYDRRCELGAEIIQEFA